MWEVENLFSDKTSAIKVQRFLEISSDLKLPTGKECYALDDDGAMWLQLPKEGKELPDDVVQFTKCASLGTKVFQLNEPKYNKFFMLCEIFETTQETEPRNLSNSNRASLQLDHDEVEFDDDDDLVNPSARIQLCATTAADEIPEGAIPFEDGNNLRKLIGGCLNKILQEREPPKQKTKCR
jgi:hypothetical protein